MTREVFWGVSTDLQTLFYLAALLSLSVFFYGFWSRISFWTKGNDTGRFKGYVTLDLIWFSFRSFFSQDCLFAKRSFSLAYYRGMMLIFSIWGFSILFIGTLLLTVHHYTFQFLVGRPYLVFSLILDIAGGLLLLGLVIAIGRRHLLRAVRQITDKSDLFFLYLFLLSVVSGFFVEGMRLTISDPLYMDFSPVGAGFSVIIVNIGLLETFGYTSFWIIHVVSVLFLIGFIPYSKFFHLFASQISVVAAKKRYGGFI